MNSLVRSSLAASTHQLYFRAWKKLVQFGQQFGLQIFPLSPSVLGLFITHMVNQRLGCNTIRTMVSAISFYHKINGLPDPAASFLISKLLIGTKKSAPSVDKRLPITVHMLHQLVRALDRVCFSPYDKKLYKSMFLCAFYALCRVGEITGSPPTHTLREADIKIKANPQRIVVTFASYKHSVTQQSVTLYEQSPLEFSPVSAIVDYLQSRPKAKYLFVLNKGQPVPRLSFVTVLKKCVAKCQFDAKRITSHCFRIGGATYAARRGLPILTIKRLGRWRSDAFVQYLRW